MTHDLDVTVVNVGACLGLDLIWRLNDDGSLTQKVKPRFTTDDSWDSKGLVESRNQAVDRSKLGQLVLPSARDLARAR